VHGLWMLNHYPLTRSGAHPHDVEL
jgi:hypothetical protein